MLVLVSPYVGEGPSKRQVAAVNEDVFQYITVTTARGNTVGRKLFHPLKCANTVRVNMYGALDSCMEVIDPEQNEMDSHQTEEFSPVGTRLWSDFNKGPE